MGSLKFSKVPSFKIHTRRMSKLAEKVIEPTFVKYLEPDVRHPEKEEALKNENGFIHIPRVLESGAFSWALPEKRKESELLVTSENALRDLGLDSDEVDKEDFKKVVSGEIYLDECKPFLKEGFPMPFSQAYAGWQFGQFAGQLGDGRVINLFELPKAFKDEHNRSNYELQLKGSGKTAFSRFADGKAVLRSSIREYIISEHLNAIGIPSTRALSLTYLPKTLAQRHGAEKCAIVSRFAESWIRLGTFDLYRWRSDRDGIRKLSDYVIKELFTVSGKEFPYFAPSFEARKDLYESSKEIIGSLTRYDKMYYEIIIRNATTTAMWQSYGFLNGVLNTDNTSVLGLSMDFGPFAIMDRYNPNYTSNSEDHENRYGYRNVPTAIWWNLTRLGENLAELIGAGSDLIDTEEFAAGVKQEWTDQIISRATKVIEVGGDVYKYEFTKQYVKTLFGRLGLSEKLITSDDCDRLNDYLLVPMFDFLYKAQCDFNKFFLSLQDIDIENSDLSNDISKVSTTLLDQITISEDKEELVAPLESWLTKYKSYVEKSLKIDTTGQLAISKSHNPLFLPRNWILDEVIEHTQDSGGEDLSYLIKLQNMASNPYDRSKWGSDLKDIEEKWMLQSDIGSDYSMLQCSCSS